MAVGALAIILVSYSESIATATDSAARHKQEFSPDQELIAQGAAWVGSSLVGGFAGCGSLSKTAVSESSGQKTQLAGLTVAGLTVLTLLFLAGMFSNLPQAVLGAVVVDAALGLIHFNVVARSPRRAGATSASSRPPRPGCSSSASSPASSSASSCRCCCSSAERRKRRCAGWPTTAQQVYVEADTHPDATTPDGVLVVR